MRDFTLHVPTRLYFGKRSLHKIGRICKANGHTRVLCVSGGNSCERNGSKDIVAASLAKHGVAGEDAPGVTANPCSLDVETIVAKARAFAPHAIIALGGGSVIDAAKITAAVCYLDAPVWELITAGKEVTRALPVYAASTLAGSGSEMNGEAVCRHPWNGETRGLRGPGLYPAASFVDPSLQQGLDWPLTRRGAIDILCHIMERYVLLREHSLLRAVAEALLRSVISLADSLRRDADAFAPRSELCWAAILAQSGQLLSGCGPGDWTAHVIAHAVTGQLPDIAHGDAVAILLPAFLEVLNDERPGLLRRWSKEVFGAPDARQGIAALRAVFRGWEAPEGFHALGCDAPTLSRAAAIARATGLRHGGLGRAAPMQEHVETILDLSR